MSSVVAPGKTIFFFTLPFFSWKSLSLKQLMWYFDSTYVFYYFLAWLLLLMDDLRIKECYWWLMKLLMLMLMLKLAHVFCLSKFCLFLASFSSFLDVLLIDSLISQSLILVSSARIVFFWTLSMWVDSSFLWPDWLI